MLKINLSLIAFFMAILSSTATFAADPCLSGNSTCLGSLSFGKLKLPYYRNFAFNKRNSAITQAVIVIHGTNRNADDYFASIADAATKAKKERETLLISLRFMTEDDSPGTNQLYWDSNGAWKIGHKSTRDYSKRLSSFALVDKIIARILKRNGNFPNLKNIVLTGHSAGGQFTQRYAAGSNITALHSRKNFRFVVANPSSYMYLNKFRRRGSSMTSFGLPNVSACSDYNKYKYGPVSRNSYMSTTPIEIMRTRFKNRTVKYLLGDADTSRGGSFDDSCKADLQGLNRFQRGQIFNNYVDRYFPNNNHSVLRVRNVNHNNYNMYNSFMGQLILFVWPN